MSYFKMALLGLITAVFGANFVYADEIGHIPISYNTPAQHNSTLELKPMPSSGYQIAAIQFLPEIRDSEFGLNNETSGNGHNTGKNCSGYKLSSCPNGATCSSCPFNRKLFKLNSCKSGYALNGNTCTPASCQGIDSSYKTDIPTDNICTKISESGLTCYKDCRSINCSGYTLDCDTFNVANSASKDICPDCAGVNANCSPKLCKVGSCLSGYKIADNGTECVPLDDNCPTNYFKTCDTGTLGDPKYTEHGTACYQCQPPEIKCEAPYYQNDKNTCVLWEGVAAVVKTCSELITTTKNGNITGNILVWGTLNCQQNPITLSTGQNLVGKGFFSKKYSDATDSITNKFSKITWNFTSGIANALTLEHNATLADMTLEIKSNVAGKWSSPYYIMPALIEAGTKENLVLKNMDLYGDMSAAESKGLTLINATTARYALQENNTFRFKNNIKTNGESSYTLNTSYLIKNGTMNIGSDATLNIEYINGGASYSIIDAVVNLTDNAKVTINDSSSLSSYSGYIFEEYNSWSDKAPKSKLTMSGTSRLTVIAPQRGISRGQIDLKDNSILNIRGKALFSGSAYMYGPYTLQMSGNSVFNGDTKANGVSGTMILNNYATLRIRSSAISTIQGGNIVLNNNAKLIVKQNTTTAPDGYAGVIRTYSKSPTMNGSSKFYIEANRHIFNGAGFNLASTSAKLYVRQTDTSQKIFGSGGSNPEVWLYSTVSNAPFYIETPGQKGYNGAEDDGMYLMPSLGVSASDGSSICSHMTGGYSSSKINRDLACWTHGTINSAVNDPANPNNNDYFKGRQCDRCSSGYRLTGVTHVSKTDSRFTSTKSDFDNEMSALTSAFNF